MSEFDFIIPVGATCITAHNVRSCGLQKESLPFDWILVSKLSMITDFLANNFRDFMHKENLVKLRDNGDADIYRDMLTKTEFWHDFMVGQDFNQSYELNYQKYQRRIKRMQTYIKHSKRILWVRIVKIRPDQTPTEKDYLFDNAPLPAEQLKQEFDSLQALYPHKHFELLLFYMYNEPRETKEYDVTPQIHICEMYNDETLGWKGDMPAIAKILGKYKLSISGKFYYAIGTLIFKIRRFMLRLSALCGSSQNRSRLKIKD